MKAKIKTNQTSVLKLTLTEKEASILGSLIMAVRWDCQRPAAEILLPDIYDACAGISSIDTDIERVWLDEE